MNILPAIFAVFTEVGNWLIESLTSLTDIFWTSSGDGGSLTFLGVLAVCGLAFSVIFLIIGIIQRFLHFRG